jgi:hypothetical protein
MPDTDTLFVVEDGAVTPVERLAKSHKRFDEAWVRDLLFKTPSVLPTESVLRDAGEFIPIAIEIPLEGSGVADLVGVTAGGYPVVVETKLWRNPQARRSVLAQTIEYVKSIARKDYEWFENLWTTHRTGDGSGSLFEATSNAQSLDLDEPEFIERVGRACRNGDVLAFIVGDGISHGLVELVDHLGRHSAHLRYYVAMLELRCFELSEGRMAVMPHIVQEVQPIERTFVRIEATPGLADQIRLSAVAQSEPAEQTRRRGTLTADEFWQDLESSIGSDDAKQARDFVTDLESKLGFEAHYKASGNLIIKVPAPGDSSTGANVLGIIKDGTAYNPQGRISTPSKWGIPKDRWHAAFDRYNERMHQIDSGFPVDGIHHWGSTKFLPLSTVLSHRDEILAACGSIAAELRALAEEGE